MYICLFSTEQQNPTYGFRFVDEDTNNIVFDSSRQFFLIPSVRSSYKSGRKAYGAAITVAKKRRYHIDAIQSVRYAYEELTKPIYVEDVSSEDMLFDHYMELIKIINSRAKGSDREDRELVFEEFKMIRFEIKNVINGITDHKDKAKMQKILSSLERIRRKHFKGMKDEDPELSSAPAMPGEPPPMPGMAEVRNMHPIVMASLLEGLDQETKLELLNEYGEYACAAIESHHKGAFYDVQEDSKGATVNIFEVKGEGYSSLLKIRVNSSMHIEAVLPSKSLNSIYPLHSVEFYQKYWKPIVERVGHFSLPDFPIVILSGSESLPDIPSDSQSFSLTGWNPIDKKEMAISLSFRGKEPTWMFEPHHETRYAYQAQEVSRYTEEDYFNATVECIDQQLKSLLGHTGRVIQIMEDSSPMEFDVDFGRGLDIVRLTEPQFKIVV